MVQDDKERDDFEDAGSVFLKYKKQILLLILMIAIIVGLFILTAMNIIPVLVADIIIIPVAVLVFLAIKKSRD